MSLHEAVVRGIDAAEEGLRRPMTVAEMADAAGYSLFHFCRVFSRCTRLSPYTYLVRRRLTLAATEVVGTPRRIVDIGTDLAFGTHDGFTRAFTRLYGVTPSGARAAGQVAESRRLPRLTVPHLACLERHGGLHPDTTAPATSAHCGVHEIALPISWPERTVPVVVDVGRPVSFSLADDDDLPLVLDWLQHVWLAAERCELAVGVALVETSVAARVVLRVVPWGPEPHRVRSQRTGGFSRQDG